MYTPLRQALLNHSSLSIIGMGKNAGKTTVLGCLINLLSEDPRTPALTSIGRDGESIDIVTGTEKPGIWVHAGTLVATASGLLRTCDITREVLATTGIHTPLGEVVVLRALSDGQVQLAGPSMRDQLARLSKLLRSLGAGIVLIDGAISRKSLSAPVVSEATILCTGASYSPDMQTVIEDTAYACRLLLLPRGTHPGKGCHMLEGAATDLALSKLALKAGDVVIVHDSSRILLSRRSFERLAAQGVTFAVQEESRLCCVCVNPFSATGMNFDAGEFLQRMAQAVPVPVLDVKGGGVYGSGV